MLFFLQGLSACFYIKGKDRCNATDVQYSTIVPYPVAYLGAVAESFNRESIRMAQYVLQSGIILGCINTRDGCYSVSVSILQYARAENKQYVQKWSN